MRCSEILRAVFLLRLLAGAQYFAPTADNAPNYGEVRDDILGTNNTALLCNSTISSANASGVYTITPGFPVNNDTDYYGAISPAWALTVAEANNTLESTLWYNTAGQNYSDDLFLNFDACAFIIRDLPENVNRLGQNDSGNCSRAISDPCRSRLQARAENSALKWTAYSTPPPYSNLTAGVLPFICKQIESEIYLNGEWPEECQVEFFSKDSHHSASIDYATLTGYNESILDALCHVSGKNRSDRFSRVGTRIIGSTDSEYDLATREIVSVITVFFPVANADRHSFFSSSQSNITCLRARDFNPRSRVSPELPAGTPYKASSGSLGAGAIAGIVAGVVMAVALLAGLGICFMVRRRRRLARSKEEAKLAKRGVEGEKVPELHGTEFQELHDEDKKPELDNGQLPELPGGQGQPPELESSPVLRR